MYYGGDPPAWTLEPAMPQDAWWVECSRPAAAKSADGRQPAVQRRFKHPLADLGGKAIPLAGAIGGAKGVGAAGGVAKRKREEQGGGSGGKKQVSEAEAAALAKREAARARVHARELKAFGLA